jgi:hypothetical protein
VCARYREREIKEENENIEKRQWDFMSIPQIALAAAQHIQTDRPVEVGFAPDANIVINEVHEGSESSEFFQGEFRSST